jgi:hypothetical protein
MSGASFHVVLRSVALAACTALGGCTGVIDLDSAAGPSGSDTGAGSPEGPESNVGRVGDQALVHDSRRLNDVEFRNTVRDLFGADLAAGLALPPTLGIDGYDTYAEGLGVDEGGAATLIDVTERIATAAVDQNLVPSCGMAEGGTAAGGIEACAGAIIDALGTRAFRRPLADTERADRVASAVAFAEEFTAGASPTPAELERELRITVVMGLLASPHFLYKVDALGEVYGALENIRAYRLASRLSYLLWASMPDAALLELARAGTLGDADVIAAEVTRMLDDPRSREPMLRFVASWIELDDVEGATKNAALFPDASALLPQFKEETSRFLSHVLFEGAGTLPELFQADYSFVNAQLAAFYGVPAPATGEFAKVQMPAGERKGLLTQGSFLAARSRPDQTSPIHRGAYIMKRLLCGELSPPADLVASAPEPMPDATLREQVEAQTSPAACAVCHKHFNGFGFALESFDAIGQFRATDEQGRPLDEFGRPTDTSVVFPEGAAVAGDYEGSMDLIDAVGESEALSKCFVRSYLRFALGRQEIPTEEAATLDALGAAFHDDGGDIAGLVTLLTTHGAFTATE